MQHLHLAASVLGFVAVIVGALSVIRGLLFVFYKLLIDCDEQTFRIQKMTDTSYEGSDELPAKNPHADFAG